MTKSSALKMLRSAPGLTQDIGDAPRNATEARSLADLRVVHVIGALAAGGAERFVVDLAREQRQGGYDVRLLVLSSKMDEAGERMAAALKESGVPFRCGPTVRVRAGSVAWYISSLLRWTPDLVHLHTPNTEMAHALGRVVYRRGHVILRTLHSAAGPPHAFGRYAIRANPAAISVACSRAALDRAQEHVKGELLVIENGVRFDWPIRTPDRSEQFKKTLGLRPECMHFVAVGRFDGAHLQTSPKAHDVLLRAWRLGRLGQKGGRLHLIGNGPLRPALEAATKDDPSVIFHGVRADVSDWLIAGDAFVMPSRWEGLPIAGIEAVGTGLPCLFSDIPPLRELRPPLALWSAVDDCSGLAQNLASLMEDYQVPASEAIEAFRKRFGLRRCYERYCEVYERALGVNGRFNL